MKNIAFMVLNSFWNVSQSHDDICENVKYVDFIRITEHAYYTSFLKVISSDYLGTYCQKCVQVISTNIADYANYG